MNTIRDLEGGDTFPYDADDAWWRSEDTPSPLPPQVTDWAHRAARGVVANLRGRHTIKWGFNNVDEETRKGLIEALADIIRVAHKQANE